MIIMVARPCQDISDFAAEMVRRAWLENDAVLGEFNQFTLEARPGMTRDQVMRDWDDAQRRSYFGQKKTGGKK